MKDILIDQDGDLRCPKCKGKNFDHKRSFKAKATFGVGALLLPKRIKCLTCGEMSKGGDAKRWRDPGKDVVQAPQRPTSRAVTREVPAAEKVCPMCAESVKEAAKVCRFCGHDFVDNDGAGR